MMLSLMASGSNAAEDKKPDEKKVEEKKTEEKKSDDKKPDEKSDRAKKILEALDKPSPMPMPKRPVAGKPVGGKDAPMMPPEITPAQRVAQLLGQADMDGSGTITRQEMAAVLDAMGPAGQQIGQRLSPVFRKLDTNRDGALSTEEANKGVQDLVSVFFPEGRGRDGGKGEGNGRREGVDPRMAFLAQAIMARLDRDRDGKISEREVMGDKQVEQAFVMADTDQDKHLSADEIAAFLQKTVAK